MKELTKEEMATKEAEANRLALIQMYQAGFTDAWGYYMGKKVVFDKIKDKCFHAFNIRFGKKVINALNAKETKKLKGKKRS